MREESTFVKHEPCPKCGSGNNLARYSDGHAHCFSGGCGHYERGNGTAPDFADVIKKPTRAFEMTGTIASIPDRKISQTIAAKFGVTVEFSPEGKIVKHHYPYYDKDTGYAIGTKVRGVENKSFYATGDFNNAGLFGQQAFKSGGKYVTITEGEVDAMAVCEMFDGKWPVVSIRSGAAGASKDIRANLEWLETFDNVCICFDNDKAGQAAAAEVLSLFTPNKAKNITLPLKDAGEMLKERKVQDFVKEWWNAKTYQPDGIISFGEEGVWEKFLKRGTEEVIPLPSCFSDLNEKMNGGIVAGEVTVIGALTSIGKTTMVSNLINGFVTESKQRIGCIFLESDVGETVENLLSPYAGINISNIPAADRDYEAYHKKYLEMSELDNLHMLDHQGSSETEALFGKIHYLVKGLECSVVVIDPLQAAVRSNDNVTIDDFMDRCLKIAKNTGVSIILISHMRQPEKGKGAHDVGEYDLKGSSSINQIAFNTILLSRDKLAEDDHARNCTFVQLVKCRRTGKTGAAGWLLYNDTTARLESVPPPMPEINVEF